MKMVISLLMLVLILISVLLSLGFIFSKKCMSEMEKLSPFECGFSSKMFHRSMFSVQFFLISIIFVIFDVELVILFPLIVDLPSQIPSMGVFIFTTIITLLTMGLVWEWMQGMLEWLD